MGSIQHHAIIVTVWGGDAQAVRDNVATLASACVDVSKMTRLVLNGCQSFLVAPDGSRKGSDSADVGAACRAQIKTYLRSLAYADGSTRVFWVEMQYGDEKECTRIVDASDATLLYLGEKLCHD
jgi:hypothetical protein